MAFFFPFIFCFFLFHEVNVRMIVFEVLEQRQVRSTVSRKISKPYKNGFIFSLIWLKADVPLGTTLSINSIRILSFLDVYHKRLCLCANSFNSSSISLPPSNMLLHCFSHKVNNATDLLQVLCSLKF